MKRNFYRVTIAGHGCGKPAVYEVYSQNELFARCHAVRANKGLPESNRVTILVELKSKSVTQ